MRSKRPSYALRRKKMQKFFMLRGKKRSITVFPTFDAPYNVEIEKKAGGHGGGDPVLLNDLFGVPEYDPFNRAASHVDGAMSILTGIAANESIKTGMPVKVKDLVLMPTIKGQ